MPPYPLSKHVLLSLAVSFLVLSCGNGGTDPSEPIDVTVVSGDGQSADVGETLLQDLVVRSSDLDGNTLRNVDLTFSIVQGGGSLGATSVNTMTRPGGVCLHDDDYPKSRSGGAELDSQEDLAVLLRTSDVGHESRSFPDEIDDHPALAGMGVVIDEDHLLPGSEREGPIDDGKSERGADQARTDMAVPVVVVPHLLMLVRTGPRSDALEGGSDIVTHQARFELHGGERRCRPDDHRSELSHTNPTLRHEALQVSRQI